MYMCIVVCVHMFLCMHMFHGTPRAHVAAASVSESASHASIQDIEHILYNIYYGIIIVQYNIVYVVQYSVFSITTVYSIQYTSYIYIYVLQSIYYIVYIYIQREREIVYSIQYIVYSTQHIVHSIQYMVYSIVVYSTASQPQTQTLT